MVLIDRLGQLPHEEKPQVIEWKSLLFVLPLFVICVAGCSRNGEHLAVKEAFEGYKSAILNDDGDTAYQLVDTNTKEWYREILQNVLLLDRAEIMKLGTVDKIQVILVRHGVPDDELRSMTGEDLFKYAVNHGWVGKNSVMGLQIGKIGVNGDFATVLSGK